MTNDNRLKNKCSSDRYQYPNENENLNSQHLSFTIDSELVI